MIDVFISHTTKDFDLASRIQERLNKAGLSTWMAETDIKPGASWEVETDKALKDASSMVLLVSPAALNSPSVGYEYRYILKQNKRLYPILVESVSSIPSQLSNLQSFSFSNDFDVEIQQLIDAIRSPAYLAQSESESSQVNVRLKINRDKLASLMATLIDAGAEKIEVENVGKSR